MHSRFVLINCPGIGVGDVRNSSSSDHSIEQLLRYAAEKDLNLDLAGLESIGFDAFVRYSGAEPRKTSVTARLAARNVYGLEDFDALNELGGGDEQHLPIFPGFPKRHPKTLTMTFFSFPLVATNLMFLLSNILQPIPMQTFAKTFSMFLVHR